MSTPEEKAALQGWKPESEWTGPKDAWKPAQQFLDDGEHIISRVKGKLEKKLEESQKEFEARLERIERANKAALDAQAASAKKERDDLLAQLNAQKKEAIEDNDLAKLESVREKIEEVRSAPVHEPDEEGLNAAKAFKAKHEFWQGKNMKLQNFADGAAGRLQGRGLSPTEFFAELDRQIRESFPEEFGKPKRAGLESDSPASGDDSKTYADLPKEAKAACDDFMKRGIFKKKQDYVDSYFGVENNA